jgi:hypothetical protein
MPCTARAAISAPAPGASAHAAEPPAKTPRPMRAWLYKIATNRCLNALRDSGRRPRAAAGSEFLSPPPEPTRRGEPLWLQPYPDALLDDLPDTAPGPEARYETREAVALAFVAGLQRLPPPTRANGQPAFGYYLEDSYAPIAHGHGLVVLTLAGDKVSAITRFGDNGLFPHFGLPRTLPM